MHIQRNHFYVIWTAETVGQNEIVDTLYFTKSTDNGTSFNETPIKISPKIDSDSDEVYLNEPELSVSDNNLYVVWTERTINQTNDMKWIYFARTSTTANIVDSCIPRTLILLSSSLIRI